ncbi:protein kinase [bacterium]|nr:protein kinase [bacterium]
MSSAANADRNLLFGMFALQNDHITQDQLIEAFQAWILRKDRPLDVIIHEKGWMTGEQIDSINALLDRRVEKYGSQQRLLEAMPDDCGILHSLAVATRDNDVLRSTATVEVFFNGSIRHDATGGRNAADFFDPTETGLAAGPVSSEPPTVFPNPQVILSESTTSPLLTPRTTGETRVRFETEFTFTEPGDFLGRGAFGEVFRSEDREFQRKVALKRLQAKHLAQGLTPVSFLLEAEINGKLDHPGVLPMYGLGKTPAGVPFYVMKAIEAPNFGQVIDEFHAAEASKSRDPGESNQQFRKLLDHLRSVCMTMQYAHDRGVLHCDLKPANIMTGSYGETYVVDWGLALLITPPLEDDWDKTRDYAPVNHPLGEIHPDRRAALHDSQGGSRGFIGGTYAYMSPEHHRAHEDTEKTSLKAMTPACDVFALGVILYQILTGKLPCTAVECEDKARQADRARTADYVPPLSVKPNVPKALSAICMKALAPEPKKRYRSAAALEDDLEKWLADEPVSAYRENHSERSRRWIRKNRGKAATIAASLVFATLMSTLGLILQSIYANEIKAERDRSQANERRALASEQAERQQRSLAQANADEAIKAKNLLQITVNSMFKLYESASKNDQIGDNSTMQKLRQDLLNKNKSVAYPNGSIVFPTSSILSFDNKMPVPFEPVKDQGQARKKELTPLNEPRLEVFVPESEPRLEVIPPVSANPNDSKISPDFLKQINDKPSIPLPELPLPELPPDFPLASSNRSLTVPPPSPVIAAPLVEDLPPLPLEILPPDAAATELKSKVSPKELYVRNESYLSKLFDAFNDCAWFLAAEAAGEPEDYSIAFTLAQKAIEIAPGRGTVLNTLGIAQYRVETYAEAAANLAKSTELNRQAAKGIEHPYDLAFLAMAQWKLGRKTEAEATFARLTESMKRPRFAGDRIARQFFREASNLIRPMSLPDDPFQP